MWSRHWILSASVLLLFSACESRHEAPEDARAGYELATYADTLAMNIVEAWGGKPAWESVRYLRFEFAGERDGERGPSVKHFWDRYDGDYRLEWVQNDTHLVALFNTQTREGEVYDGGERLEGPHRDELLERAYARFINDTYWLMAPAKVFDPGVTRQYAADSSDAGYEVLHLSFEDVGLTPGDQYWLFANTEDYRVDRWAFVLQGWQEGQAAEFRWAGYERFDTPGGPVYISTRKETADGTRAILTDRIELPEQPPERIFQEPEQRL